MIRFIIKRHMDNGRTVGTSSFETLDVDVPDLERALTGGGHYLAGGYDLRELVGVEVLPMPVVTESPVCGNCGETAPGCGGKFSSDGKACAFHGSQAPAPASEESPCACWPGRMCSHSKVCAQSVHQSTAVGAEREQLRAAQVAAVMPLIGPLLDAWEQADREVMDEEPELVKWLKAINTAMETAGEAEL